jgi:tetratricopeptide (TPR) repeat protein
MRRLASFAILTLLVFAALTEGARPPASAQDVGALEPAHLVVVVEGGGDARINRVDWDVNAFAPVFPGTAVRGSDYIDLSGRTTLQIVCADLTLLDQRGSEVPRCNPYPEQAVFFYVDDPAWSMSGGATTTVVTLPADLAAIPPEVVNPSAYNLNELTGGELDAALGSVSAILALNLPAEAQAFALSQFYRGQGVYFEALGALTALPDLGCSARRPAVEPPQGDARPLAQSPVTYLRIGELYEILGQQEDALRNYQCAVTLAEALGDTADAALGYARWGNIEPDPAQAVAHYQTSINLYTLLGAQDNANAMLEICGSRSCAPGQ